MERAVGIFVLGGLACLGYFAFQLGSTNLRGSESYTIQARFGSAVGLNSGSQILIAGVPVGTVGPLKLGKDFSALVELRIRKDIQLSTDTVASIRGRGLLGDKYVALTPGGDDKTLASGSTITDTESAVDIESLLSRFAFGSIQQDKKTPPRNETPAQP